LSPTRAAPRTKCLAVGLVIKKGRFAVDDQCADFAALDHLAQIVCPTIQRNVIDYGNSSLQPGIRRPGCCGSLPLCLAEVSDFPSATAKEKQTRDHQNKLDEEVAETELGQVRHRD
jgi:hypothetical protein